MKRIIAILMSLILSVLFTGCRSNSMSNSKKDSNRFTIRSGITFGMTREEVFEIERKEYGHTEYREGRESGFYRQEDVEIGIDTLDEFELGKDAFVRYRFNVDNEKLYEVYFCMGEYTIMSPDTYSAVYKKLLGKYGEPKIDEIYDAELNTTISYEHQLEMYIGHLTDPKHFNQWQIQYDDCIIVIELYLYQRVIDGICVMELAYRCVPLDGLSSPEI